MASVLTQRKLAADGRCCHVPCSTWVLPTPGSFLQLLTRSVPCLWHAACSNARSRSLLASRRSWSQSLSWRRASRYNTCQHTPGRPAAAHGSCSRHDRQAAAVPQGWCSAVHVQAEGRQPSCCRLALCACAATYMDTPHSRTIPAECACAQR